ncbi:HAMP domain-containing sensor histidine kinase [Danxiaibacter flavus]|uniref:histidine kinase n=1 Tax=Danxiaibacter flavus TaxID=3049108 RepID=A0ABV3ZM67_9BACT|nr:HAMP domain-containing sensor histidine kinase [Chitinophagaceae bacterium DXS]
MIKQWLNWRTLLAFIAIIIVSGTIWYSQYLANKIAIDETRRVESWVEAQRTIMQAPDEANLNLAIKISSENEDIPIIETNEKDSITNNYLNLDTIKVKEDAGYLLHKLKEFKRLHAPIVMVLTKSPYTANKYYYGKSKLQSQVRYYPIVQLIIVTLFIIVTIIAQQTTYRSRQNQLWVGMAKETAHQLGTPVTSLKGWIEVLKEIPGTESINPELVKDVNRLELITDRFGKIGSQPQLEERNIISQLQYMVDYMKKRASNRVEFRLDTEGKPEIAAMISPPLFDWVIENLLKNALDAMEGQGKIEVHVAEAPAKITIDVTDSGKGISKANIANVFKPGFTTKKRGWGLGLTLTKRIMKQYHKGDIFIKWSEVGKGTTFRIELVRQN